MIPSLCYARILLLARFSVERKAPRYFFCLFEFKLLWTLFRRGVPFALLDWWRIFNRKRLN